MNSRSEVLIDERTADASGFAPHQQRVIVERRELKDRLLKLRIFINNSPVFRTLSEDEQDRLGRQMLIMQLYLDVLSERVYSFLPRCDP